jgi:hypothetical protein
MYQSDNVELSYEQLRSVMVKMLHGGSGGQLNDLKTAVRAVGMRLFPQSLLRDLI